MKKVWFLIFILFFVFSLIYCVNEKQGILEDKNKIKEKINIENSEIISYSSNKKFRLVKKDNKFFLLDNQNSIIRDFGSIYFYTSGIYDTLYISDCGDIISISGTNVFSGEEITFYNFSNSKEISFRSGTMVNDLEFKEIFFPNIVKFVNNNLYLNVILENQNGEKLIYFIKFDCKGKIKFKKQIKHEAINFSSSKKKEDLILILDNRNIRSDIYEFILLDKFGKEIKKGEVRGSFYCNSLIRFNDEENICLTANISDNKKNRKQINIILENSKKSKIIEYEESEILRDVKFFNNKNIAVISQRADGEFKLEIINFNGEILFSKEFQEEFSSISINKENKELLINNRIKINESDINNKGRD